MGQGGDWPLCWADQDSSCAHTAPWQPLKSHTTCALSAPCMPPFGPDVPTFSLTRMSLLACTATCKSTPSALAILPLRPTSAGCTPLQHWSSADGPHTPVTPLHHPHPTFTLPLSMPPPASSLQPCNTPAEESTSMDFIVQLPISINGYDAILVVVDRRLRLLQAPPTLRRPQDLRATAFSLTHQTPSPPRTQTHAHSQTHTRTATYPAYSFHHPSSHMNHSPVRGCTVTAAAAGATHT